MRTSRLRKGKHRYLVPLTDYAQLSSEDIHFRWPGQQNSITYKDTQSLDIPVNQLDWLPFPNTPHPVINDLLELQASPNLTTNIGPLSPQQKTYMAIHRATFFELNVFNF